jgi:hypothetical protein
MRPSLVFSLVVLTFSTVIFAQNPPAWVTRSNENAKLLIDIDARYSPEDAAATGVKGLDDRIISLAPDTPARMRADLRAAKGAFEQHLATEKDPLVRQDLEILIASADRDIRGSEANEKSFLPYANIAGAIYYGVKSLLDDQIAPERRPAALIRLKKYTGMQAGFAPLVDQEMHRFHEKVKTKGLLGPPRVEVQKNLDNTDTYITGIGLLLEKYKIQGYEPAFAKLKEQLATYDDFVRREVLPKSRTDFRLPPAIYAMNLERAGADYTPAELERLAHKSFSDIQRQMQELAAKIAKDRGYKDSDYRSVVRELKKEQLSAEDILPHYQKRLAEIEDILKTKNLITLPERPAIIKIASAAETAAQPAPHMQPPPLLNNHGERGAFVLPLETPGANGTSLKYDDFTFAAASWTLIAHEARPGHELQFDAMVEKGVSQARALYAFNSTNVEGWGLYSEWFVLPYMPDDGKLISLQLRLLRSARAFLDPELQEGKVTPERAMQILENDVVCSKAFATEEVERFTFRSPGQAVAYFDGFNRILEIREAAEKAQGASFDVRKFHDFIISQGLLPPAVLRKAVLAEFTASAR